MHTCNKKIPTKEVHLIKKFDDVHQNAKIQKARLTQLFLSTGFEAGLTAYFLTGRSGNHLQGTPGYVSE